MEDIFLSDFLELGDVVEKNGIFDSIINSDSKFYINIIRLKNTNCKYFAKSYQRINNYFKNIIKLLTASDKKNDRFFREALSKFNFHGVKGINLGFSTSGKDIGFGYKTSKNVISDAFDIVKKGILDPEIFHLIGLFEENIGPDRLSDMIATIIYEDIVSYTKYINKELSIVPEKRKHLEFRNGIVQNPYKKCDLLYLPIDILHQLPIMREWEDLEQVAHKNRIIREQMNNAIGEQWYKISTRDKKRYIKQTFFYNKSNCKKIIDEYREAKINSYDLNDNFEYAVSTTFKKIERSGVLSFLSHGNSDNNSLSITLQIIDTFKNWIEENKGWDVLQSLPKCNKEKLAQRLLHLSGKNICKDHNWDLSFEPNEGAGPVDMKVSRGNDKTLVEIKLSSNPNYFSGLEKQLIKYGKSENTSKLVYLYIKTESHPHRDDKILAIKNSNKSENIVIVIIDALPQKSASLL